MLIGSSRHADPLFAQICWRSRDVSADLKGALIAPQITHRAAILDPKGVGELLRAIEAFSGQPTVLAALRLAPHVFVRPGELRHAEWTEFDAGKAVWTIPAHKTKMRRPHKVPLSRQAHGIINELHALSGDGQYLFPCARTPRRPMSENTINAALRRLGYDETEISLTKPAIAARSKVPNPRLRAARESPNRLALKDEWPKKWPCSFPALDQTNLLYRFS